MSDARATVVVVHGLWMPGTETLLLRRRLEAAGLATRAFRYRSVVDDLGASATQLLEFVRDVPGETMHFVGHSLGGVLILEALRRESLARPGRVVCLASPLAGSQTAVALLGWPGGRRLLGKCVREHVGRGGCAAWNGSRDVGVIAGDASFGLGRLLVGDLAGPNDGTVAVAETRLGGCADHIVLPVSHSAMLWSRDVHRQVVGFLQTGKFLRDA